MLNKNKLKALIHYIIDAVPQSLLGKVKLNKILWFSEREMYLRTGRSITGETYLKFPEGPVSENLPSLLAELHAEGKIVTRKAKVIDYERIEYISLSTPDISLLSKEEIDVVGRQSAWIIQLSARQISEISHDRAWELANNKEEIPMFATLTINTRPLTPDELRWAEGDA